jgi:hypothetical protein
MKKITILFVVMLALASCKKDVKKEGEGVKNAYATVGGRRMAHINESLVPEYDFRSAGGLSITLSAEVVGQTMLTMYSTLLPYEGGGTNPNIRVQNRGITLPHTQILTIPSSLRGKRWILQTLLTSSSGVEHRIEFKAIVVL